MGVWDYVKLVLASDYTLFSAVIGATVGNMAAFGTDQDMVQRMLTAETHQKARRSLVTAAFMDVPIAGAFVFIGILLFVFYQQDPTFRPGATADVFASYILNVMPVGVRGFVVAGVFATAMGSFSAALNALATSATNDWYLHWVRGRSQTHYVRVARGFTVLFAALMVAIAGAFAYAKVTTPDVRIIPVVLGIAGFILGPMLGVFLIGMLTTGRGSDRGNLLAITAGLLATVVSGKLHIMILNGVAPWLGLAATFRQPAWIPEVAFTWWAMVGAVVVVAVGLCFRTPDAVRAGGGPPRARQRRAGRRSPWTCGEGPGFPERRFSAILPPLNDHSLLEAEDAMSSTFLYRLPVEQTQWKVEGQTTTAFTWEYEDGSEDLLRLYAKGKKQQWDAADRLDWSQDVDPGQPDGHVGPDHRDPRDRSLEQPRREGPGAHPAQPAGPLALAVHARRAGRAHRDRQDRADRARPTSPSSTRRPR